MSAPEEQPNDGGVLNQAPAVVLPSPNAQGVGGQPSGFAPGALVAPQPLLDDDPAGGSLTLAGRIEQVLAEDGRFSAFASRLVITADDDDAVHLAGPVPSEDRRRSLVATLRALPGVTDVQDALTVE